MDPKVKVIDEISTEFDNYKVIERLEKNGLPARLLYGSGDLTVHSGIPLYTTDIPLFRYNRRLVEIVKSLRPHQVLVVGGGVYTLPSYLAEKYNNMQIDVIEPDNQLEDIAIKYFNFHKLKNLKIINDFGLHFLKTNKKIYDLIIIDAYYDHQIPKEINSKKFARLTASSLSKSGILAANVISDIKKDSIVNKFHANYKKYFKNYQIYPVDNNRLLLRKDNLIYVASQESIKLYLKYPPLKWNNILT